MDRPYILDLAHPEFREIAAEWTFVGGLDAAQVEDPGRFPIGSWTWPPRI